MSFLRHPFAKLGLSFKDGQEPQNGIQLLWPYFWNDILAHGISQAVRRLRNSSIRSASFTIWSWRVFAAR
jgi:hypothetical protein